MKYLTTQQVCDTLHISRKKAYELYKLKGFPAIQIGKDYRVEEEELHNFLKKRNNTQILLK